MHGARVGRAPLGSQLLGPPPTSLLSAVCTWLMSRDPQGRRVLLCSRHGREGLSHSRVTGGAVVQG